MRNVILLNLALRGLGRRQINVSQAAAANAVLSEVIQLEILYWRVFVTVFEEVIHYLVSN